MKWIALVLPFLLAIAPARAASFDCAKASTKVEHIICDNQNISTLDEELDAQYSLALRDKSKAGEIKREQKLWMTVRNGCSDTACVKHAYEKRLSQMNHVLSAGGLINTKNATHGSQPDHPYYFSLTKGAGTPVCDAYLVRLNKTSYEAPPYCDRPENGSVTGFARLSRVAVPVATINRLNPIVSTFMLSANSKGLDWADANLQRRIASKNKGTALEMQNWLGRNAKWAKVWTYDPPVDIDNDGTPDNVQIWSGSILPHGVGGRVCGGDISDINGSNVPLHQPQVALAINADNDQIDAKKTESIFGHPKGGYPIMMNGKWTESGDFRPIGTSIGIFEYRGTYYFDTFFDGWGDFEGKRVAVYSHGKYRNIINTLGIFVSKNGKTRQVCEYKMSTRRSD